MTTGRLSRPETGRCAMAFYDLKPVRVFDEASGCTYIVGDTFAVYSFGTERPTVYSWEMIKSVSDDSRKGITFQTDNTQYKLPMSCFKIREDYFRLIAITESMHRKYSFSYQHGARVLPTKDMYIEAGAGDEAYVGEGHIDENDTAAAFVMLMNLRLVKVLWLIAMLVMLLVFAALHITIGVTRENILYFIPISIAVGGILTLIVYIICHAVARSRFTRIAGSDPAVEEPLTFVISPYGFAACESCAYDRQDLIPWNKLDYFIETDKIYILYKDGNAVTYIPKKAFDKKHINGISDMMAIHLEQK